MSETPKVIPGGEPTDEPTLPTEGLVLTPEMIWAKIWAHYLAATNRNELDISWARRKILSPEDFVVELLGSKLILTFHYSNKLQVAENYITEPGELPRFINEAFNGTFSEVIIRVKNQDDPPKNSRGHRRPPSIVDVANDARYMTPG